MFDDDLCEWGPRKQGFSLGRINFVPPGTGDLYYMRLLLNVQVGITSYEALRTVSGFVYDTFRDACAALGLLENDRESIDGIRQASILGSGSYLRGLFVTLLLSNGMSSPVKVWDETWHILAEGILYSRRKELCSPGTFASKLLIHRKLSFENF